MVILFCIWVVALGREIIQANSGNITILQEIGPNLRLCPGKSCYSNEFTLNGKCYVVMQNNKMYQYQPSNDTWIQKATYPGYWCRFKVSIAGNNNAYMGYGDYQDNILHRYDPILNVWYDVMDMPQFLRMCCINFSLDNRLYIGGGNSSVLLWRY